MSELGWKYLTAGDKGTILRGILDGRAYGGPYHAEIHPADRCNIDCFFCSTASIRGTDELPLRRFEELLVELKAAGTRSIRLSGGGEPFFHRQPKKFLGAIVESGIPIENVTTNAVLMGEEIVDLLIAARCDQVTVSLNTADPKTYASMMQTPERNFERVLKNIRHLVAGKKRRRIESPGVNLQFLVWKANYRSIPRMYDLARELDADTIQFNGLAFLREEQKMSVDEIDEMITLYEQLLRRDEYRKISVVSSFELDISGRVREISDRLTTERLKKSKPTRLIDLLLRQDFTLKEKLEHRQRMAKLQQLTEALGDAEEFCIIGWHSLVIRTDGTVAPCCILQDKRVGNVMNEPVESIWYGEGFRALRQDLSEIMIAGNDWEYDAARARSLLPMCGMKGAETCPIRSFYFRSDVPFMREFNRTLATIREPSSIAKAK